MTGIRDDEDEDEDENPCGCADRAPAVEYWICPECGAEWFPLDDDDD